MKNISKTLDIRLIEKKDKLDVINIMKCLSDFFSPETIEYAEEIISSLKGFISVQDNKIIGFIVFDMIEEASAKIYRMGVLLEFQNQGVGSKLLEETENELRKSGIKELQLITLGEHPDYPGYVFTRIFYDKHNFEVVDFYMEEDIKLLKMRKYL